MERLITILRSRHGGWQVNLVTNPPKNRGKLIVITGIPCRNVGGRPGSGSNSGEFQSHSIYCRLDISQRCRFVDFISKVYLNLEKKKNAKRENNLSRQKPLNSH